MDNFFLYDGDIQLILQFKISFEKYCPVFPKNPYKNFFLGHPVDGMISGILPAGKNLLAAFRMVSCINFVTNIWVFIQDMYIDSNICSVNLVYSASLNAIFLVNAFRKIAIEIFFFSSLKDDFFDFCYCLEE